LHLGFLLIATLAALLDKNAAASCKRRLKAIVMAAQTMDAYEVLTDRYLPLPRRGIGLVSDNFSPQCRDH
jgi:hypothetical protein